MMLDKLSPQWRHAIILLVGAVLTYVTELVPQIPADVRPVAAALIAIATLAWTPLTKQYGVGVETSD